MKCFLIFEQSKNMVEHCYQFHIFYLTLVKMFHQSMIRVISRQTWGASLQESLNLLGFTVVHPRQTQLLSLFIMFLYGFDWA